MELYGAFDLHASNSFLGIIDEDGRRIFRKKLYNDTEFIQVSADASCRRHSSGLDDHA